MKGGSALHATKMKTTIVVTLSLLVICALTATAAENSSERKNELEHKQLALRGWFSDSSSDDSDSDSDGDTADDDVVDVVSSKLSFASVSLGLPITPGSFDDAAKQELKSIIATVTATHKDYVFIENVHNIARRRLLSGIQVDIQIAAPSTRIVKVVTSLCTHNLKDAMEASQLSLFSSIEEVTILKPAAEIVQAEKSKESDSSSDDDHHHGKGKKIAKKVGMIIGSIMFWVGIFFLVRRFYRMRRSSNQEDTSSVTQQTTDAGGVVCAVERIGAGDKATDDIKDQGLCYPVPGETVARPLFASEGDVRLPNAVELRVVAEHEGSK